ncbi:cysteine desulfurase family protein [Granulicoccus sp. GXG6511]|uniref:cysteine desulfurase family protein n=1 Tax=Granulicoccus sp. GXG6511 TaxID=3381351 RepID=UPI003D7DAE74
MRSYLDHAASSPMVPEAAAALTARLGLAGNASSLHAAGRAARAVLEDAREQIADDLRAHPTEVVFTSGGTEADNLAIQGAWRARPRGTIARRDRLVRSAVEHPAVAETMAALGREGADVAIVPVDHEGLLDIAALASALETPTQLTSVMWVNNETGTIQPIDEVVACARAAGTWVHSDAVQAVGHVPVQFAESELDLLSLSAHKIGGPIGIGALLVRRELPLRAYAFGGGQERDLRSGTAAPALAAAFAAAVHRAVRDLDDESARLERLVERMRYAVRLFGGVVNGRPGSPAILNVSFPGARADDLLLLLDAEGFDCSTGSACTAGVHQPSPVLLAMGRDENQARESLRLSFGWNTTAVDLTRLVAALPHVVERARLAGGR